MTEPAWTKLFTMVHHPHVYQVTQYLSPTQTVKVTRRRFQGKLLTARAKSETLLVTVGRPNFRERQFIRLCRRANEQFPIKKLQLRVCPQRTKA